MSWIKVQTWRESEVSELLRDIGRAAGLVDGEPVEIEARDGQIHIRRVSKSPVKGSADALAAVEELIANRKGHSLAGLSIRELIDEGRK